jgi:fibronectin-binding autotransporter adhesin
MKRQLPLYLVMLPVILLAGGDKLSAQTLTFDPSLDTPATGSFGSGTWDDGGTFDTPVAGTTADWSNGTTDQAYIDGNSVVFGGTNTGGAIATVTLVDPVQPGVAAGNVASITFNTSGYDIVPQSAADTITFEDQNAITVATGVSAEVDAEFDMDLSDSSVVNGNTQFPNAHDISITGNTGSTLTLRGGISSDLQTAGKSISFGGGGTLNIDGAVGATTDSSANVLYFVGNIFAGTGTIVLNTGATITGGDKAGLAFGQGDDVPGGNGTFTQTGGVVNAFNTNQGQGNSYVVNIQGGVFSTNVYDVGTGGSSSAQTEVLNISGGQFITNPGINGQPLGILQFDNDTSTTLVSSTVNISGGVSDIIGGVVFGNSGTVEAGNSAALNISGGEVFIGGSSGISSLGSITAANTAITLSGGTIGALSDWSSSENIKLSNANGGVTFQTSDVGSTIAGNAGGSDTYSFTASGAAHTVTLTGILSGNGSITASGGGHLITTGANTYSGGTSVINGTEFTLASAGTGNVHVDANFSDLQLTLSTAIAATATLTLDSATTSKVDLDFSLTGTDVIGALDIDGTSIAAGTYTAAELDAMTIGGVTVTDFSDNSGGLNSLTVGVVPEPSTWTLLLSGLGLVGLVVRRRHAANQI